MTRMDINGNSISKSRRSLAPLVKRAKTYTTDSAGRIMVDDDKGGYVVFFQDDEPELAAWVVEHLESA